MDKSFIWILRQKAQKMCVNNED